MSKTEPSRSHSKLLDSNILLMPLQYGRLKDSDSAFERRAGWASLALRAGKDSLCSPRLTPHWYLKAPAALICFELLGTCPFTSLTYDPAPVTLSSALGWPSEAIPF